MKQLKTTIKALKKELELLQRPQNSVEAPKTSDIINISSSPIRSAEYEKEIQEIRALWDDSNNSFDEMI